MNYELRIKNKGFTIVELLVAMSLFMILLGIAIGGFVNALKMQKAIAGLAGINDSASLVLEQMAREIRTGYDFDKVSDTELQFINIYGQKVGYQLNGEAIERGIEDVSLTPPAIVYKKITADNVKIADFNIIILDKTIPGGYYYQPRVTIGLSVGSMDKNLENIFTNIQTTVSARRLDS